MFCSKGWVDGSNAYADASFRFDSFRSLAASSWAVQAIAIPRVPYQSPHPLSYQIDQSAAQDNVSVKHPVPPQRDGAITRPARYGIADPTHSCRLEEPHCLRALPCPPTLVKTSTLMAGAVPQLLRADQGKVDPLLESRPALVMLGPCLWGNTATRTRASEKVRTRATRHWIVSVFTLARGQSYAQNQERKKAMSDTFI